MRLAWATCPPTGRGIRAYAQSRDLGGFVLIDKQSNATVAAGMLHFALRRSENIHWQRLDVTREVRADLKKHRPRCSGSRHSGAGKSTMQSGGEKLAACRHTFLLDATTCATDSTAISGFPTRSGRKRAPRGEVARLMTDAD